MKKFSCLLLLSFILSSGSLAITRAHPTPSEHTSQTMGVHENRNVDTTEHTEARTQVDKDTIKKKTTTEQADQQKAPLTVSITAINKSITSIFALAGNPSVLDEQEIYKLAKDPHITGQEAATLAAMILVVSNTPNPKNVIYNKTGLLSRFNNPHGGLYYAYTLALGNINGVRTLPANEKLFGPGGITFQTQIIQNNDNDCYLLSAINGILQTTGGPSALQQMIQPIPGKIDEFSVQFPGDPTAVAVKLTDTELGMYSTLTTGGKWLSIISVAEAKRRDKGHFDPEITMNAGSQAQTFSLLTGEKYTYFNFPTTGLSAKKTQWFIDTITSALNDNIPIGISTNIHCLTVIGYENNQVIIKNPWGTNGWYNPVTAGSSNSMSKPSSPGPWYIMSNGIFAVPINAIVSSGFSYITYDRHQKKNVSTSFIPKLTVPAFIFSNEPPANFVPSEHVAPMKHDDKIKPVTSEEKNCRSNSDKPCDAGDF